MSSLIVRTHLNPADRHPSLLLTPPVLSQRRASAPLARGLATQASATPIASTSSSTTATRPRLQQMRENIRELDDFLAADAALPAEGDKVVFKKGKA